MLEKLKIKHMIEMGDPDWTPFDTLGGLSIGSSENFRKGFIFEAAEQCHQALEGQTLLAHNRTRLIKLMSFSRLVSSLLY
jgi:hypothetical protein